jgi:MFS superfamily sulfate permease-like transporter
MTIHPTTEIKLRPPPTLSAVTRASLGLDLAAGLTLAAIAIPEQMATARLGGFAPQTGLIAFVAATVGFALFGASRRLSVGADSTITTIFAGALGVAAAAGAAGRAETGAVLAAMVGALMILAGVLKLGWIADLMSRPVLTGFLAGIALHIARSQAPAILGGPQLSWIAAAIGLGVCAVSLAAERVSPRFPAAFVALAAATWATAFFGLEHKGVTVLGAVSGDLPAPGLPTAEPQTLVRLAGLALVVSLVVMVQTGATSRAFASPGSDGDADRDFLGVGVGGLLSCLFGAFPVNASPPRTAAVADAGGRSQFAGLTAALVVLLVLVFGTRWLAHIPTAALAGVLLFVAVRLVHLRTFLEILGRTRSEFALALLTAALIIVLPIQTGVAIGMFLSLAHGVFTITRTQVIAFERAPGTTVWWPVSTKLPGEQAPGVLVLGFQAPLSFLNAYEFRRGVLQALSRRPTGTRLLVLEASSIVEVDFTAAGLLCDVIAQARRDGVDFRVARLESVRAHAAFERFGVMDCLGPDRLFRTVEEAVTKSYPDQ